ncbi:MAG: DUF1573 domain-containing protein [Candidatus Hydrogenedentes bacterium]|nr:DUF1573 domain-containing protein [Candidatus Hydrogenedentota bacterium]
MKIYKVQHIAFLVIILCTTLVIFIILTSKNNNSVSPSVLTDAKASLPPIGDNFEQTPKIELETGNLFDFGTIPNDKETTKRVKVFNKGKGPLYLRSIQTTCACTQGTIPVGQEVILPNGEGHILITVIPSKIVGFYSEKTLTIYTNDPHNSTFELKVIAKVEPEFLIEPESIDFGEVLKGSTYETTATITQKSMSKPLEIYKIYEPGIPDSINNNISYTIRKTESNDRELKYLVTFTLEPFSSPGEFNRTLYISTNIDRYPEVPIKIKGKIVAPYKLSISFPTPLIFNDLLKNSPKEVIIESIDDNGTFEIISYEVVPSGIFSAEYFKREKNIVFNIKCKEVPTETYGLLTLKLTHKGILYEDRILLKSFKKTIL